MGHPLKITPLITLAPILLAVAYFTLIERKIIGAGHTRCGPNKVGPQGTLQPFRDAIKLFSKENIKINKINYFLINLAPGLAVFIYLTVWATEPIRASKNNNKIAFMLFITLIRVSVFFLILRG